VTDPFPQSALPHAHRNDTKVHSLYFHSFILHLRLSLASRKKSLRVASVRTAVRPSVCHHVSVTKPANVSYRCCVYNKQTNNAASSAQQRYCLTNSYVFRPPLVATRSVHCTARHDTSHAASERDPFGSQRWRQKFVCVLRTAYRIQYRQLLTVHEATHCH